MAKFSKIPEKFDKQNFGKKDAFRGKKIKILQKFSKQNAIKNCTSHNSVFLRAGLKFSIEICEYFLLYFHYKILCLLPARRNTKTLSATLFKKSQYEIQ